MIVKDCSFQAVSLPSSVTIAAVTLVAVGGITALVVGLLNQFSPIISLKALSQWTLISSGSFIELTLIACGVYRLYKKKQYAADERKPKGFLKSPYSFGATIRFLANHMTNGRFSIINQDRESMTLLKRKGQIQFQKASGLSSVKVLFLGDMMVSKSGEPPSLDKKMQELLATAQVIVANVEAPVISSTKETRRGLSLKFEMSNQYLKRIYDSNCSAQWVFSIANNHACDTSTQDEEDVSGVRNTIESIQALMPTAAIIGAEIGNAQQIFSLEIDNGSTIGFVGWTEVMNNDGHHFKKKIIRETDLSDEKVADLRCEHTILIGFPHGNEEQSYYPLKKTRDRWCQLVSPDKFDAIIGHGPHVLHPAELVNEKGLLFHSIGNFCSPVGRSQTRVGCIPEINLIFGERGLPIRMEYEVHLLEQQEETVTLLKSIDESIYPEIIARLKTIWGSLFSES